MWEYLVKRVRPARPRKETSDLHAAHDVVLTPGSKPVKRDMPGEEASRRPSTTDSVVGKGGQRQLVCPACSHSMEKKMMGGAEIDECPSCGGMFLDRGELKLISGRDFSSFQKSQGVSKQNEDKFIIYTPHGLSDHVRNPD